MNSALSEPFSLHLHPHCQAIHPKQSVSSTTLDNYFKTPDHESTEVSESEILQLMMHDMLRKNFKMSQ